MRPIAYDRKRRFILFAHTRPDFHFFFRKKFFAQKTQPCSAFLQGCFRKKNKKIHSHNHYIFQYPLTNNNVWHLCKTSFDAKNPHDYIFQYPMTNNMFRYLENKQLKNGGLNTLRVPKTGKVCHVFDPGAHTGRVEAKDGNIIETQHLNIESKHQLKAHCAIIWPLLSSTFVREGGTGLIFGSKERPNLFIFFFLRYGLTPLTKFRTKFMTRALDYLHIAPIIIPRKNVWYLPESGRRTAVSQRALKYLFL